MAIRIGVGPYIENHRLAYASSDPDLADGWSDGTDKIDLSHVYDRRGFGVQRLKANQAGIAGATDQYISYRTDAVGVQAAVKYALSFCAQTDDAGSIVYYQVIGWPSNDILFGATTSTLATTDLTRLIRDGASSQGTDNDTYYEIRLGADTLADTKYIEFSRFVTLQHTFETAANYKEMSVSPQVEGSVFGSFGFAQFNRDSAGNGFFQDGTPGYRKQRLVLPFRQIPQSDLDWLEQFYYHTRSTPAPDSNRMLVVYDTNLPAPGDSILAAAQVNPNYFAWVDAEFPFSQPSNTWMPSDSKFQGVMNLEEP